MSKYRLSFVTLLIAVLGLYTGCNMGPKGPLTVPLQMRPGRAQSISTPISAVDVKVFLAPVNDKRENKEQIGENVERPEAVPVFSSGKTPAEFVHDALEKELKDAGLELTDAAEAADRVIELDLTRFWVREDSSFRAEVQAVAQIRSKSGAAKWKERLAGEGKTSGRSLNPANYQQTLSDATLRMVNAMLVNERFAAALSR